MSIFRGEVKERCIAAIAPLLGVLESPAAIVDLVCKVKDDFNFIFPRCLNGNVSFYSVETTLTNFLLFSPMPSSAHLKPVGLIRARSLSQRYEIFIFRGIRHSLQNIRTSSHVTKEQMETLLGRYQRQWWHWYQQQRVLLFASRSFI